MNAWTFLDRNSHGFFLLAVLALMYAFGTCGSGEDKIGCKTYIEAKVKPSDAGE